MRPPPGVSYPFRQMGICPTKNLLEEDEEEEVEGIICELSFVATNNPPPPLPPHGLIDYCLTNNFDRVTLMTSLLRSLLIQSISSHTSM